MGRLKRLAGTSVGSKAFMAVTGLLLFLFVIAHLSGNLTLWAGRDTMNDYAEFLANRGALLWIFRFLLLSIFVVHVFFGIRLYFQNRAARPVKYQHEDTIEATLASRFMIHTGVILLLFVIYHLLHFTLHVIPTGDVAMVDGRKDVYGMVIAAFSNGWIAGSYIVCMIFLGFHLVHGSKSLFQTLGWDHVLMKPIVNGLAPALAFFVVGGNILLPLSVVLGWVS